MNAQEQIIQHLTSTLAQVPDFGALITEDSANRILDADDPSLPRSFILLQQSETTEEQRGGTNSVKESMVVHIVLVTRETQYAAALRAGRYHVKRLLAGRKCGLTSMSSVLADNTGFMTETRRNPQPGQVLAAHDLPLRITYVQNYQETP